jgi:hypothetical protein
MQTPRLKRRDGTAVVSAAIDAFRNDFRGQASLPGDGESKTVRLIWNASIDRYLAV